MKEILDQSNRNRKLPITDFSYDPIQGKFFRFGLEWKRKGVDALVGRVKHQGRLIKATQWLELHAVGR